MKLTKRCLPVLFLFLALLFCGCQDALKSYNAGLDAYGEGRFSDACALFEQAVSQGEKSGKIHADLALSYLRSGNTEKADEEILTAKDLAPDDPDVLKKAGLFFYYQNDKKAALSYFQRSLTSDIKALNERDLETCAYAAEIEKSSGNYNEAIRLYNLLIEAGYHPQEHEFLAGDCYLELQQIDADCQYFDMLASHSETSPYYYLAIYKKLWEKKAYTKAENYFNKGVLLTEKEESPVSKGEYYASAGKYEAANAYFKEETRLTGLLAKARTLQENQRYDEAEAVYVELLKRGDVNADVYNQYMMLKMRTGAYTEAFQLLTQVKSYKDPEVMKQALWNEVVLYELTEDYETAFDRLNDYINTYEVPESVKREYRFLSRVKKG